MSTNALWATVFVSLSAMVIVACLVTQSASPCTCVLALVFVVCMMWLL